MTSTVRAPATAAAAPAREPRRGQRWRLPVALVAGLLLVLAFPPIGVWPAAPLGVAVLAVAVRGAGPGRGALAGLLCGLGLFVPLLRWEQPVGGALAWLALAVLESLFLLPLGAALALVSRLRAWPVWGAALWVGEEALRDRLPFGGFPWGRLAFSQAGSPLAPLAALGGAPLVTAGAALLGGLLAAAALAAARRLSWSALLVPGALALATVAGALLVPTPTGGQQVRVAMVQGGVPRLGLDAFAQRAAVLDNHVAATHRLAEDVRAGRQPRPDLVLWPENASDLDPYSDPAAFDLIDAAVRDIGVPVLVGAVVDGPGAELSNTGIVWDPATGPGRTYVKQHPVPFGEYMPYRSLLRRITPKVDLVPRDFARGTGTGVLQVGPARIGDVICFEVAYDGLVRDAVRQGGRVIVVQTNNASFGRSGESPQQLAMGRLRAVEHGRAVLVVSTSGISAVVAPDGTVEQSAGISTAATLVADVPMRDAQTLATRLGALPELAMSLLGAGVLALALVRRRS